MSTTALASTLEDIVDGLAAALPEVNVFSGEVSTEEAGLKCVAFGECRLSESPAGMGGYRQETWEIDGEIRRVVTGWQGTTEETIRAAREDALTIFAAIETYLNDTYVGDMPDVNLSSGQMVSSYGPDVRWCSLLFTLELSNLKNP